MKGTGWNIKQITILNKSEISAGEGDRLAEAKIYVDGLECGALPATTVGGELYTVKCNNGLGRIGKSQIKVVNAKSKQLHFCDIRVYGT